MADIVDMIPRVFAVLYDGTNSAQILSYLPPGALVSEAAGVLMFYNNNSNHSVSTGTYVVYRGDAGSPYATIDANSTGATAAELAYGFIAVPPGTLPS